MVAAAGIRKAVVAAGIHKAVAAGIRRAIVAAVDTDNTVGEAAFAVDWASLTASRSCRKTWPRTQPGYRI